MHSNWHSTHSLTANSRMAASKWMNRRMNLTQTGGIPTSIPSHEYTRPIQIRTPPIAEHFRAIHGVHLLNRLIKRRSLEFCTAKFTRHHPPRAQESTSASPTELHNDCCPFFLHTNKLSTPATPTNDYTHVQGKVNTILQ
mmetsp:Transcript_13023/g.37717  ORF Transcript_13023/g.37717 Transcript_13023/m.37717 type:complete len:140 (+) Transcript_13023:101-520(+)